MKKWVLAFIYAFGLNFIWENLHHSLYIPYHPLVMNDFALVLAALADAVIILVLLKLLSSFQPWVLIVAGVAVAVIVEQLALSWGWWSYAEAMPIIPVFDTGLTPILQLGLLAYVTRRLVFKY